VKVYPNECAKSRLVVTGKVAHSTNVAERRESQLKRSSLTVVPAGHWLQIDEPEQVAKAMLSEAWKTAAE